MGYTIFPNAYYWNIGVGIEKHFTKLRLVFVPGAI